jgi:Txe/YoeB family toxin of Txe-Axe toxin-antitoxin module
MWEIYERRLVSKSRKSIPVEVLKRYEKWKDIASISGPAGFRNIQGFHDESLSGNWKGYRSSRLNIQCRVMYKVAKREIYVQVEDVSPHDYRKE